jgi:AraC family transcriptional activator of pobA
MDRYDFNKTKYGPELLIDLIRLETLDKYPIRNRPHVLSYYDITLITGGSGTFHLDEFSYPIEPRQLFFTSPMQVRKWEIEKIPRGLVLIFEEEFLCTFFNDSQFVQKLSYFNTISHQPALMLADADFFHLENVLKHIEEEIVAQAEKDNHLLRALLYQVLVWLNRQYLKLNSGLEQASGDSVFEFRKLVDNFFNDQHSVSFYADRLHITAGHLNEVVKKNFGISAKEYLQNRLFLEAKRLLLYSSLTISEIAWKLHFQDNSYFVRAFKNKTGCTPQSYKNAMNPRKVPFHP